MGIDVRTYTQKGQDIVRSSCVGWYVSVCQGADFRLENSDKNKKTDVIQYINGVFRWQIKE
jgi:hypothetical protein